MTKTKSTKRALLMSGLALLMCVSMLIGSTFAWFTDSVTSAGNKIQSGTLKLDLELLDKESGEWASIKEDKTALFNNTKWEPGYTEVKLLKVENEGSLALKWIAKFISEAKLSILADVIDVYVLPYGVLENDSIVTYPSDRSLEGYTRAGTLAEFVNSIETTMCGSLKANESAYFGLALKMQETAGNEYQGLDLGGVFDIQILATQDTVEADSFGTEYDATATYSMLSTSKAVPDNATAPMSLYTDDEYGIAVEIAPETLNSLSDSIKTIQLVHSTPNFDTFNESVIVGSLDLVDQDGNVIDLEALGNTTPIEVVLPVNNTFSVGDIVEIYHDGEKIAEAEVDSNKEITYYATHFCQVVVTEKLIVTVTFSDGYMRNFKTLSQAMGFGYSGGEQVAITVYEDITEEMSSLEGNIVCGKEGGVTITNTIYDEWIYCDTTNFTIGEGVTYKAEGYASGLFVYGDNCVINGDVIVDCYYQRYADTKLTINAPGSMKVNTETFILRYTDGDGEAGIYINGDNNDETVEFNLAVAYFYQGMISAKDATLKVGTYWQTNTTDGQGSANLILDNSKLTVTVNEHNFKALGNATVTLKNGSVLDVAGGIETTNEIVVDGTSTVKKAR